MGRFYGIRGATTVEKNCPKEIMEETIKLLHMIQEENSLQNQNIISIFFTMTPDLNAIFPAEAARELGLTLVPLLCAVEIAVPGAIEKCIRVLLHVVHQGDCSIRHVYLNRAKELRPDLCAEEGGNEDACKE